MAGVGVKNALSLKTCSDTIYASSSMKCTWLVACLMVTPEVIRLAILPGILCRYSSNSASRLGISTGDFPVNIRQRSAYLALKPLMSSRWNQSWRSLNRTAEIA